jgi:hypothetical protein
MLIVSGTKRSGTSMWMQALAAAGLEVVGDAFPKRWKDGPLREANPAGFYEHMFRDGVFFGTNPNPQTGEFVRAEDVAGKVVKVFVPGVVRTELAYIDLVIANIREWREYEASVNRLWGLDDAQRAQEEPGAPAEVRVPATLEWWAENFSLVRDQQLRRYPIQLQTYDQVLRDPEKYVGRALHAIGRGDLRAALGAIEPGYRTQQRVESDSVPAHVAEAFDELYDAIATERAFDGPLVQRLVSVDRELRPRLAELKVERARQVLERGGLPHTFFLLAATMS